MQETSSDFYETKLCIIKRYKYRGRLEMYIHAEKLREFIKSHALNVAAEDFQGTTVFKKKMFFKSMAYGKVLAKLLERIQSHTSSEMADIHSIQSWLDAENTKMQLIRSSLSASDFESELEFQAACHTQYLSSK